MKIVLALAGAALIGGCATVPPPQQLASAAQSTNTGAVTCDYETMARVNQRAQALRTQVHWVNCPLLTHNRADPVS